MSEAAIRWTVFIVSWIIAYLIVGAATTWVTAVVLLVSFLLALVLSCIDLIIIGVFSMFDNL